MTPALDRALRAWFDADPWRRAMPGEGMVTTDEPWECYACFGSVPYAEPDTSQPKWWEKPVIDGPHADDCLWVATRDYLTTPTP